MPRFQSTPRDWRPARALARLRHDSIVLTSIKRPFLPCSIAEKSPQRSTRGMLELGRLCLLISFNPFPIPTHKLHRYFQQHKHYQTIRRLFFHPPCLFAERIPASLSSFTSTKNCTVDSRFPHISAKFCCMGVSAKLCSETLGFAR